MCSKQIYKEALKIYKAAGFVSDRLALKITDNYYRILYLCNIHDNPKLRQALNNEEEDGCE